jgi:hypothetical protein
MGVRVLRRISMRVILCAIVLCDNPKQLLNAISYGFGVRFVRCKNTLAVMCHAILCEGA